MSPAAVAVSDPVFEMPRVLALEHADDLLLGQAFLGSPLDLGPDARKGTAPCVEFFGSCFTAFSDVRVDSTAFISSTTSWFRKAPSPVAPETSTTSTCCATGTAKYASFNLSFDRLQMLEQLGLAPTPVVAQ